MGAGASGLDAARVLDVLSCVPGTATDMEHTPYCLQNAARWDGELYETISQWDLDAMFSIFTKCKLKHQPGMILSEPTRSSIATTAFNRVRLRTGYCC